MDELERIVGQKGLKEAARTMWKEMTPKILSQADLEGQSSGVISAMRVGNDLKGVCYSRA